MPPKDCSAERPIRRRVSQEESDLLDTIRRLSEENGFDVSDIKHGWHKTEEASLFFRNPNYTPKEYKDFQVMADTLVERVAAAAPKFIPIGREKVRHPHLLVIDPADVHIGKLSSAFETGEEYNSQIAVQRTIEGVQGILRKAKAFNVDQILFIGGNDILHTDNPKKTTTGGTLQDTDGMWYDNFLMAEKLYVDIIMMMLGVADVHFVHTPSNHDYMMGFLLARVIESHFKHCDNITFDTTMAHRKGYKYGNNLIGMTHGDGAKVQDLPLLMAQEFPQWWAETKHRYIYTHHVHHKMSKDYVGVTVESLRSPSASDSWHHRNGYQHAPKAIEGYAHCMEHGQVSRMTHIF